MVDDVQTHDFECPDEEETSTEQEEKTAIPSKDLDSQRQDQLETDFSSKTEEISGVELFRMQFSNMSLNILSLLLIIGTALLRGGEGSKSLIGIGHCSSFSWLLFIMSQVVAFFIMVRAYKKNKKQLDEDEHHESNEVDGSYLV